jgi:heptosyltransferase-2
MQKTNTCKKLYIRLSSLGDVVLAMSALEVKLPNQELNQVSSVDWLVAREFASLLEGHPKVRKVWVFDRKLGFKGWKELGHALWNEGFDEVDDLHCTLRTKVLKVLFLYWSWKADQKLPIWKVISKQRLRLYSYFLLKSFLPKRFRPDSVTRRTARLVGGTGLEKPSARHLLEFSKDTEIFAPSSSGKFSLNALLSQLKGKSYICVMPGSRWPGKKWPVEFFADLLMKMPCVPVVMGTLADSESDQLVKILRERGSPVISAVGPWSLREVAQIMAGAWRYLGNDTGLGHLAEAVGVPSFVIFGPTKEDMGFGPWHSKSRAIGKDLACRPCGKDGRYCYRLDQRFACLKQLRPDDVLAQISDSVVEVSSESAEHLR